MTRYRHGLVFLVAFLGIGACSGAGGEAPSLAPGTTAPAATSASSSIAPSSSAAPTTTTEGTAPPPTTTEAPADEAPIPQTQGLDDFTAIWTELVEYHNWAFQNPVNADPAQYKDQKTSKREVVLGPLELRPQPFLSLSV